MPFEKGNKHSKGRQKGSKNKVSREARELFLQIMEGEVSNIKESLAILRENDDKDYLKALSSFMPYFMPKQVEQEVTITEPTGQPSWFDEIPTEE